MNITLYQNLSESNRIYKTLNEAGTITGTLRNGSSVLDPIIRVATTETNIIYVNYIYIVEWRKFYFVNNITNIRNGLWELKCHVDVLSTYRDNFMNLSGIIARQEYLFNLYLDDDKFLTDCKRIYWTKTFPNRIKPGSDSDSTSFIITIAGGE